MIWVLALGLMLWLLGAVFGVPRRSRWIVLGGLYAVVVLAHLVLPAGSGIRLATGGSVGPWLILGGVGLAVWLYASWLGRLRAKAAPDQAPDPDRPFTDAELKRYARHIILREIGGPGQKRLKDAKVLVIGAGGLGSPALMYLAAAGVGTLGVIDDDVVELSNLQRQIIHTPYNEGQPKVQSAEERLSELNGFIQVKPYQRRLTEEIAEDLIAEYDLVLDGSDNFDTRYLVNRICARLGKPLIAAALTQWEGQISLYDPARGTPCYECVFPERPAPGLVPTCAEAGVLGPLPGVVGAMMAVEAVKALTGAGEGLGSRLMIYDALYGETRTMRLKRREGCPVCG